MSMLRMVIAVLALLGGPLLLGSTALQALAQGTDGVLKIEVSQGDVVRLERPAASVFIADPAIADVQILSPTTLYVFGKSTGVTSLSVVDSQENVLFNRQVVVDHNLATLRTALTELLPGRQIRVQSTTGGLILIGTVPSATDADDAQRVAQLFVGDGEQVINRLQTTNPNQVMLKVTVAEVSKNFNKRLSINWDDITTNIGSAFLGFQIGRDVLNAAGGFDLAGGNGLAFSDTFGDTSINTLLEAEAENNLVKILAQPTLTAMSGEPASFLAGGEFPIVTRDEEGNFIVTFKPFGVSLAFTPTVIGADMVNLRVSPEVSELGEGVVLDNISIPGLITRRADTTVELRSGQTFVLGGLMRNSSNQNIDKFPILGDLPILGALFRSTTFRNNDTELVIAVTPYLVKPMSSHRLATPVDGYTPPNDSELFLEGQFVGNTGKQLPPAAMSAGKHNGITVNQSYGTTGDVGYTLD